MLHKPPGPIVGSEESNAWASIRVAIVAGSDEHQQHLAALLRKAGLVVVILSISSDGLVHALETQPADVLLVDLSEEAESQIAIIDTLLEYDGIPVLYNDSSAAGGDANAVWAKKLARKLSRMVRQSVPEVSVPQVIDESLPEATDEKSPQSHNNALTEAAVNVWVLGASLGGPQAVRQFLAAVDLDLPVAFVLAQHIGANHISLLAKQLNRITGFRVLAGVNGHQLRHHEVLLAPADKSLSITAGGLIALSPALPDTIYSPSIDNVITVVAEQYGKNAGAIVFSGMGGDGAKGCEIMAHHRGVVWAQDVNSCVISSMPDQARKTRTVTFSANPQTLAKQLCRYYHAEAGSAPG
ncbi:MAG: chemotaxis protein CheB [Gammaproteobacteria bacterium]|nr:chemotaxis protein CheB [Gammaproteobacteria bacterium]